MGRSQKEHRKAIVEQQQDAQTEGWPDSAQVLLLTERSLHTGHESLPISSIKSGL